MTRTIEISTTATFYRGSGQAVIATVDGAPIDAIYYDDLMQEQGIKAGLKSRYPGCRTAAGMMSCYEFTAFDPSEFQRA